MNHTSLSGGRNPAGDHAASDVLKPRTILCGIRDRILAGLLVILPILITIWVMQWLYAGLDAYVIDPFARVVLWKARQVQGEPDLPPWFENYAAPVLAVGLIVGLLYACGFLAHTQLRQWIDRVLLRLPVISIVYDAVRNVLQCLDKPSTQAKPQRLVLISFPHPGMRLPAFVTSTCQDIETNKTLLCVYVPTTPVPTSGFFLMVPEDEVTELNWSTEQTLQAIISGGLAAPPQVTYFSQLAAASLAPRLAPAAGEVPAGSAAGS